MLWRGRPWVPARSRYSNASSSLGQIISDKSFRICRALPFVWSTVQKGALGAFGKRKGTWVPELFRRVWSISLGGVTSSFSPCTLGRSRVLPLDFCSLTGGIHVLSHVNSPESSAFCVSLQHCTSVLQDHGGAPAISHTVISEYVLITLLRFSASARSGAGLYRLYWSPDGR